MNKSWFFIKQQCWLCKSGKVLRFEVSKDRNCFEMNLYSLPFVKKRKRWKFSWLQIWKSVTLYFLKVLNWNLLLLKRTYEFKTNKCFFLYLPFRSRARISSLIHQSIAIIVSNKNTNNGSERVIRDIILTNKTQCI